MKFFTFIILLLALCSCGTLRPSEQNRITIQFRDSAIEEYYALGVRDSSFVVAPYQIGPVSLRDVMATAGVIPFDNIEKVYYKGNRTFGSFLYHVFGGGLGGSLIGVVSLLWLAETFTQTDEEKTKTFLDGAPYALGIGFSVGLVGGAYWFHQDQELSPGNTDDIKTLREHNALYHELDPEELKNIK